MHPLAGLVDSIRSLPDRPDQAFVVVETLTRTLERAAESENRMDHAPVKALAELPLSFAPGWPGGTLYQAWFRSDWRDPNWRIYYAEIVAARIHLALLPDGFEHLRAATDDENWAVRESAITALARTWPNHPQTRPFLLDCTTSRASIGERMEALSALARYWPEHPQTRPRIRDRAVHDRNPLVRQTAVEALARGWPEENATWILIEERFAKDDHFGVRSAALTAIANGRTDVSTTYLLVRQAALADPEMFVRQAAIRALARLWPDHGDVLRVLKTCAEQPKSDEDAQAAFEAVTLLGADDPATQPWLAGLALGAQRWIVREAATLELSNGWAHHPMTLGVLQQVTAEDRHPEVRQAALWRIAAE